MKIVFAGTTFFAAYILNEIINYGYDVSLVLTLPDKPSGRGMKINASEVKELAIKKNLKLIQPRNINNNQELLKFLEEAKPDVMVVVAYGLLIPKEILSLPKFYAINVHASILPRWRGAAPIQRAIEAGDKKTGITIIKMDEGLDTGDILSIEECNILPNYTALDLHDILVKIGAKQCIFTLNNINKIIPYKQDNFGVTYANKISKQEAKIIWSESAISIVRKIKAFNPVPGAWTLFHNNILKLWDAQVVRLDFNLNLRAGTLLIKNGLLFVSCENSYIQLLEIQLSGGKRMLVQDFLKNGKIKNNDLLV